MSCTLFRLSPAAKRPLRVTSLVVLVFALSSSAVRAQDTAAPNGNGEAAAIRGLVIDAASGEPLSLARVYLERVLPVPSPASRSAARSDAEDAPFHAIRTVVTDAAGAYAFEDVMPGRYRVHTQYPGYGSSTVDVELVGRASARITVGLELRPVPLAAVEITANPPQPFHRTASPAADVQGARRTVAHSRQAEFLESDVRSLTSGDVLEAVTFAESDLFRALQRVPGISRRDDYTAVLWTRGAPWVQTRVYFDGLPLYNPTHGGWLFSAVNPDGIGEANFHPGVRSAAWGEGAAGILDLRSRSGGRGDLNARGELSLASGRLGIDGELPGGITWMLSGRRTYVDVLTSTLQTMGGADDLHVPYDFTDAIGRLDVPLLFGATLEASGIVESDNLRGDIPRVLEGNRATWGNRAGRLTLRMPLGPVQASASTGGTRFATRVSDVHLQAAPPGEGGMLQRSGALSTEASRLPELESSIAHDRTGIRLESSRVWANRISWAAGLDVVRDSVSYDGPFVLTGEGIPGLPEDARVPYTFREEQEYRAWWGEMRLLPHARLELQPGLRVEVGDSSSNVGERRVAPRLSGRWWPTSSVALSAGWGRSFQYTQAIGAAAGPLGPQLHLGNLWVLAGTFYPAIRSDVTTLGLERWIEETWLVSANGYLRHSTGVAEPDPTPGPVTSTRSFVEAENRARGLELSARKLVGRWTAAFGYAYGHSVMETADLAYASSADVRHTVDLTSAYRLDGNFRLGGAFSYASGVPFTRLVISGEPELEAPGAERTPAYASLDLMLDYNRRLGAWDVGAYVQLLNVLGRGNRVTYAGSRNLCHPSSADIPGSRATCPVPAIHDEFTAGLPRLPLIGFRVSF